MIALGYLFYYKIHIDFITMLIIGATVFVLHVIDYFRCGGGDDTGSQLHQRDSESQ